jgi:HPr kinase/phosphorylase
MSSSGTKPTPPSVGQFFEAHGKELELELVSGEKGLDRLIREPTVNRPGLALSGFYNYFAPKRIQVFGSAELSYLQNLPKTDRTPCLRRFFGCTIPCLVIARTQEKYLAALKKLLG